MTEIPEHLLQRSRERRAAAGLPTEGGDAAASTPAAGTATPATTAAVAPATPAAAPAPRVEAPKPVPAYVAAAQTRQRIPFWAMPVLAALPLWLFVYVNAMTRQPVQVTGPLRSGASAYSNCASCHGGDGSGGVGYPLYNGEVLKSFPKIEDQIRFIYNGNKAYIGQTYTPADRVGGAHVGGVKGIAGAMPTWGGQITDAQILGVVCHERYTLSGADSAGKYQTEFNTWCSPDSENWAKVQDGGFKAVGLDVSASIALPSPAAASA